MNHPKSPFKVGDRVWVNPPALVAIEHGGPVQGIVKLTNGYMSSVDVDKYGEQAIVNRVLTKVKE